MRPTIDSTKSLRTRELLDELPLYLFANQNRLHPKKPMKEGNLYGFVTIENALEEKWIIELQKDHSEICYANIEEVVAAGWLVD